MVCLSIGYPSLENQMKIINSQRYQNPLMDLKAVTNAENVYVRTVVVSART